MNIEDLPVETQEEIRESDAAYLKYARRRSWQEQYHFGIIPKLSTVFGGPFTHIQELWVCPEHEYCTTSVTWLLIHALKRHREEVLGW